MKLLVHEWCCSGGLAGPDVREVVGEGDDVRALALEGWAMFRAVLADATSDHGFEVTALVDERRPLAVPDRVRRRAVPQGGELETLVEEAARADATLIIAPETAGVLARRVAAIRAAGCTVLAPQARFIEIASDKQATIDTLAAAGVPVPAGRSLEPGEEWPRWFRLPAVRKHRSSVGCDELLIVRPGDPVPRSSARPSRLEAFVEGQPVGVSCLVGPAGIHPLPPMRQRLSPGSCPRYVGGEPLMHPMLRERAERLAARAIAAVARPAGGTQAGWIGVDMILGSGGDGLDDRVLEVNPRLTTSFVGLAAAAPRSLVRAIVDAAAARPPSPTDFPDGFAFALPDHDSATPATV